LKYPGYKYFYASFDFIILISSLLISHELYYRFFTDKYLSLSHLVYADYLVFIISGIIFLLIFQYFHLYKINIFLTRALQLSLIVKCQLYGVLAMVLLSFFTKISSISDSRLFIGIFFNVSLILFILLRVFTLQFIYAKLLGNNIFRKKILIIGAGKSALLFAQKLSFENVLGIEIIGFLDDSLPAGAVVFNKLKVLGKIDDIEQLKEENDFNEVSICIDKIDMNRLLEIIDICKNLNIYVKVTSDLFGIIPQKMFAEEYYDIPVIDVSTKINFTIYSVFKRILDFSGALSGVFLLLPFFIVISLIIKLTSKGPVIFKQVRVGKDGTPFHFFKFRSMTTGDSDDKVRENEMIKFMKGNGKGEKVINNNRVTGIGKFLRKYSLDELPQLFNVLKGQMSLVGPRPCLPYEYDNYDEWQKRRLSVLPGCTGLWQVSGRSEVNFSDSVIMDLYYINNISPWLDLQLIFKTIPVMILAKGGK
jgi:exopolysaccharide biosynthesis polyprenyl glycosylphosphotransferase